MNGKTLNLLVITLALSFIFGTATPANAKLFEKKEKPKQVKEESAPKENETKKESLVPASKAKIKIDNPVYDFGEIAPDSMNEAKFAFKNVGEDILKIDHLQGTCKCTVPDLAKKEYAPGETGEVTVQFHAPKYQGPTSQHVIVFSNDAQTPRAELEIKAYIKLAVHVSPENLNLSLLDPNAGAQPITFVSTDNEKFAITKIESTGNVISFDFDPNNVSEKHVLEPIVNTTYLRNNLSGAISFTVNHPKCKDLRVQWTSLKEFEASPSVIILRNANPGEIQKRSIYLTSNYNQPIVIESVTSDKGIVKVTNQVQTENRFQFDVDIVPPAKEGQLRVFSDTLHIKINGKDEINIPCRGFYKSN
ncbi:MAG: hypothetical protein A2Y10_18545 [Planctomycetes bacterium GWF2_41_51]|nr:MAG: hypothetical protein A2Y10_18545 [Planctomycetes bacterium GWF2_41_51]HBG27154.1 hypothetical protein [Phycisphaerales bacterium]